MREQVRRREPLRQLAGSNPFLPTEPQAAQLAGLNLAQPTEPLRQLSWLG